MAKKFGNDLLAETAKNVFDKRGQLDKIDINDILVNALTKNSSLGLRILGKIWNSNTDFNVSKGYSSYTNGNKSLSMVGTDLFFNGFKLGMGEFTKGAVSSNLRNFHDVMVD